MVAYQMLSQTKPNSFSLAIKMAGKCVYCISDFHTMYTRIYLTMLTDSLADITQYVFQVLEVARSVTNQTNNDTAKELFIKRLNESDMYFADKPIPANESDANASVLCSSVEGAKKYCPNRWKAMQNWFAEARKVNN